ncbi:MAG: sigma-54-dependent Fis family transcriptional regulator [Bacteroidaceae bacterium]|nr:sigma-54-dependent Fis family transcriptional regulator [Bacteroidaceae bacterium]
MKCKGTVLIVDDNEDVLLSLNMVLRPWIETIRVTRDPERIIEFMDSLSPDVILLDMNFTKDAVSGEEGYMWLNRILKHDPQAVVLFITAYVSTEKAVKAIKAGAVDFIPKPWDSNRIVEIVREAIDLRLSRVEAVRQVQTQSNSAVGGKREFIGESQPIMALKQQIARIAPTEANVLITGDNGTGKDVVAHEIHRLSLRSSRQLVCIDMGSLPENLFESELFGYEKGAFTGAVSAKSGRIEEADGGTLFLDEIGNLTPALQQKLLTVIEKRQISRIGSTKVKNINVRIIAATNAPLKELVREGKFREDLYFRLNTIEVHVPPLNTRGNDILLLARHFLKLYTARYNGSGKELTAADEAALLAYCWPGNVRELQHCMERRAIDSEYPLPDSSGSDNNMATAMPENDGALFSLNLEELERQAILKALEQSDGHLSQAASLLGITRYALYRKIDKYGL